MVSDTPFTDYSSLTALEAQADYSKSLMDSYGAIITRELSIGRNGRYVLLYTQDVNGRVSMAEIEVLKATTMTTGFISSTTTDQNGYYLFDNLKYSGGYVVSVYTSTLPRYVSKVSTYDGTDGGTGCDRPCRGAEWLLAQFGYSDSQHQQ